MSYSFQKIADSWSAMSDTEKHNALEGTQYMKPTITELSALGKFKVVSEDKISVTVDGVPKPQLVLPTKLIKTSSFEHINTITIDDNVSGGGIVKYAITTDMQGYYVYDSTIQEWVIINGTYNAATEKIDYHNLTKNEIASSGMTSDAILALDSGAWDKICTYDIGTGIAFAYLLDIDTADDVAEVDTITFNVDMMGIWKKATHNTDYEYAYTAPDTLKVKLKTDGSYKINYLS